MGGRPVWEELREREPPEELEDRLEEADDVEAEEGDPELEEDRRRRPDRLSPPGEEESWPLSAEERPELIFPERCRRSIISSKEICSAGSSGRTRGGPPSGRGVGSPRCRWASASSGEWELKSLTTVGPQGLAAFRGDQVQGPGGAAICCSAAAAASWIPSPPGSITLTVTK